MSFLLSTRSSFPAPALGLGLVVLGLFSVPDLHSANTTSRLTPIFNGKDLTGWKASAPNQWRVENGVLVGESDEKQTGSMLWTEKNYGDFVFETDVRWDGPYDSGVMMRQGALQVQIGTSISKKRDFTGSFYLGKLGYLESAQAKDALKYLKLGDWNTLRIEAKGTTFTVSINGHKVSQYSDPKYAEPGPIGLQIHPKLKMKVEFRNIRVGALP